ncbi:MAG: hypothetical protein ACFE8B_02820 [Candidatus Hermodarchaeota archaeon]
MIIGKGIIIGLTFFLNSYFFFVIIVIFNEDRLNNLKNSKQQISLIEEITTKAMKLRKLTDDLQNKLLE